MCLKSIGGIVLYILFFNLVFSISGVFWTPSMVAHAAFLGAPEDTAMWMDHEELPYW